MDRANVQSPPGYSNTKLYAAGDRKMDLGINVVENFLINMSRLKLVVLRVKGELDRSLRYRVVDNFGDSLSGHMFDHSSMTSTT